MLDLTGEQADRGYRYTSDSPILFLSPSSLQDRGVSDPFATAKLQEVTTIQSRVLKAANSLRNKPYFHVIPIQAQYQTLLGAASGARQKASNSRVVGAMQACLSKFRDSVFVDGTGRPAQQVARFRGGVMELRHRWQISLLAMFLCAICKGMQMYMMAAVL